MDIKNVKMNVKLKPWQADVVRDVEKYGNGYFFFVKSRRQCGKSLMLSVLLVKAAINTSGCISICLSVTLSQSRKIYQQIAEVLNKANLLKKQNEVQLTLTLINGSQILFKSAEQATGLRGYTVTRGGVLVIDECSFIQDKVFFEVLPYVNVSKAPVICVSTPFHKNGWFYEWYMRGYENGNTILSYDWSEYDMSELLSAEVLETYRRNMSASAFKTEYLGEFLDNESSVFGDYSTCISDEPIDWENVVFGIDWGTGGGNDYTAITILSTDYKVVEIVAFNSLDETQTINEIIKLINMYKPLKVMVEENSIGKVFYGLLEKAIRNNSYKPMLLKFLTTNASKERIINNLQVKIQNNEITFPNDKRLIVQLDNYEMKLTNNNNHTYNAASGFNDDILMSLMIAIEVLNKGSYALR